MRLQRGVAPLKEKYLFNLSKIELTSAEKSVLDKGLKFVPPRKFNTFSTFIDVQKYIRRLNIQIHFLSQPLTTSRVMGRDNNAHTGLSNPALFNLPGNMASSLNVFRSLVLKDLDQLPNRRIYINPTITSGLKSLCERKNLIVCPTDKGEGIVILDKEEYIKEMSRILDDRSRYGLLSNDPS